MLERSEFIEHTSAIHHFIPTLGLHIEFKQSHKILACSCDTEPCDEVAGLSEGLMSLSMKCPGKPLDIPR